MPSFLLFNIKCVPDIGLLVGSEKKENLQEVIIALELRNKKDMNPKSEKFSDVILKLRQHGKKDQPLKLYVVIVYIFQIKKLFKVKNGLNR